jgi:hypothetical protein
MKTNYSKTSKMSIIISDDFESQQEKITKLNYKIASLTEEVQLIEMTLDQPKPKKPLLSSKL